ncbi:MAG: GDP-L-fucose synthase [Minisyncoccia bacterium]
MSIEKPQKDSKIFVAGHRGLVGSAILRALTDAGYTNIVTRTHVELDLENQNSVDLFFAKEKPEYVFLTAAKVGGILANKTYPAEFIRTNLAIEINVIESARIYGAKKLLFLGSSCIYPRMATQPIKEEYLFTGPLEKTNEAYAIAKIAGIVMCQAYRTQYGSNFISAMPTNLYGPDDNFDPLHSHVLPGLMRRFHEAKIAGSTEVEVWGTGSPRREFLHVNDLASALVFLMETYNENEPINIGTGEDISIKELAELLREVTSYTGMLSWDHTKPDGTPQKLLDVSKLHALGWKHSISLEDGIHDTYRWYLEHQAMPHAKSER